MQVGRTTETNTNQNRRFLQQVDLLTLTGAVFTLFLALSNDPWWTLTGTTTSRLLNIQLSPFYTQTSLIGSAANPPFTAVLGSFTRLFLILGFIALAAASIRPLAWWRQIAIYLGLTSLAEIYLSFLLMYHALQTALLTEYNVVPAYAGTTMLRATIIGLDLNYYSNPLVTASFGPLFYMGLLSFGLVEGRIFLKTIQHMGRISALGGGLREVYLTPPYQHVWLSSEDKDLNPLSTDPQQLTDDQLLVSFEKLYNAIEPGGALDMILPAWATQLGDRFRRIVPYVGFTMEKSEIIYRTQGSPETEIRFEKPVPQVTPLPEASQIAQTIEDDQTIPPSLELSQATAEFEQPPAEEKAAEPAWIPVSVTKLERVILRDAVTVINARREPVPYRELLNQVYLDLVDRKIDFDSARQIETTLLNHTGRELSIIEEEDETRSRVVRKWWLGEHKISSARKISLKPVLRRARAKPSLVHKLLRKWERKPHYRPKRKTEDE